jgi:hypothetical protein
MAASTVPIILVVAANERRPLAEDTPFEVEDIQTGIWRRMSPERKAELIVGICAALDDMVVEGVRRRYPNAGPREQFLRRAIVRLGYEHACEAYPDAVGLMP